MTGWANRNRTLERAALAAALACALAPSGLWAQDGQFDLRNRPTPTPEPTVVGPVDPENPTVTRPRPAPTAAPPPLVVPSAAPTAAASTPPPGTQTIPQALPRSTATRTAQPTLDQGVAPTQSERPGPQVGESPLASTPAPTRPSPRAYQPRNLDLAPESSAFGLWLALGALASLLGFAGWLVWSRYYRNRAVALPEVEIERPRVPHAVAEPEPAPAAVAALPLPDFGLQLVLQATRMSATLMNTTLSYRLSVTNRSSDALRDVRVDGDMIAAHASLRQEKVIGRNAAVLPPLHRIATLAPGESVTLGGDIRLPLVSITPIRRGDAAFFVPLARLRARGVAPTGVSVEGGGTFLVGQEPGANRKLQPFRLDLGPRNYSKLGQQLLPAA